MATNDRPQSGHGATIAIELDPVGTPGVFTTVAELNGDINWPGLERPWTETTPHQAGIDNGVTGRLGRGELTFSTNFLYDNETHDHLTGLTKKIIDNEFFGVRLLGPGGTDDDDEWIGSGFVTNVSQTSPVREGARTAECGFRFSGPQIIDGVEIS